MREILRTLLLDMDPFGADGGRRQGLPLMRKGSSMTDSARRRRPTSPGEILREEYLVPLHLTQKQLADHLGCDVKVVNRIVNGRSAVTAGMALKLGAAFRTTPEFWLNAQKA